MSDVKDILRKVSIGEMTVDEAELLLKQKPFEDIGYAKPDYHRALRQGAAEVIYGEGKTAEQICGISVSLIDADQERVLITRLSEEKYAEVVGMFDTSAQQNLSHAQPSDTLSDQHTAAVHRETSSLHQSTASASTCYSRSTVSVQCQNMHIQYFHSARIALIGDMPEPDVSGRIVVATGGTSDIPVAEEAAVTAEAMGNSVTRLYDVGVAGIHRLLAHSDDIMSANVIIAIAGMEGALASVIGGLADCPVIAVPTSVGYGASFGGLSALLSMLNSCASGVSVVNIDNGFGAGYLASMINHRTS